MAWFEMSELLTLNDVNWSALFTPLLLFACIATGIAAFIGIAWVEDRTDRASFPVLNRAHWHCHWHCIGCHCEQLPALVVVVQFRKPDGIKHTVAHTIMLCMHQQRFIPSVIGPMRKCTSAELPWQFNSQLLNHSTYYSSSVHSH